MIWQYDASIYYFVLFYLNLSIRNVDSLSYLFKNVFVAIQINSNGYFFCIVLYFLLVHLLYNSLVIQFIYLCTIIIDINNNLY